MTVKGGEAESVMGITWNEAQGRPDTSSQESSPRGITQDAPYSPGNEFEQHAWNAVR